MLQKLTVALRYAALIILIMATGTNARSQTREEVFADIQKILNKAKGEKMKSFTGEEKITRQDFTVATVACYKQGLGKYGSEWVHRYTNISWNDLFEHYVFSEYSNEKLQMVQLKFKKKFTTEFFTSDKAGDDDPDQYDKMELYARTKDKAELESLLQQLYKFKEKKAESLFNAEIRQFTKEQTISWLKEKFKTHLEGDQFTREVKIVSLDECKMVVTYANLVRKFEAVIPTAIKSITKYGSFEYETKIASVRTTTPDRIDKGDPSFGIYSAIGIRNDDEVAMDNIGAALKHLSGFCGKATPGPSGTKNSVAVKTPAPVNKISVDNGSQYDFDPDLKPSLMLSKKTGTIKAPAETYNGQWYLSFPTTETPFPGQSVMRRKDFPEKDIEERQAKGLYIADISFGGKDMPWFITFVKTGYTSQRWSLKKTRDEIADEILQMWKYNSNYSVTEVRYIDNKWLMVAAEGTSMNKQKLHRSEQFPDETIDKYWIEGYDVSSIAYGAGGWLTVFSTGLSKKQGYLTTDELTNEKIFSLLKQGKLVTHIIKKSMRYFVIYEETPGTAYEVTEKLNWNFYDPIIQSYWKTKQNLYKAIYVPGRFTDDYGY